MPALVGNLREWRQNGGEDLPGNKRIHGNSHDFCVVALVNGKERYVWHLVKTRLEVHNPLLDDMSATSLGTFNLSTTPRPVYSEISFDYSQYYPAQPRCTYMLAPCVQYARTLYPATRV